MSGPSDIDWPEKFRQAFWSWESHNSPVFSLSTTPDNIVVAEETAKSGDQEGEIAEEPQQIAVQREHYPPKYGTIVKNRYCFLEPGDLDVLELTKLVPSEKSAFTRMKDVTETPTGPPQKKSPDQSPPRPADVITSAQHATYIRTLMSACDFLRPYYEKAFVEAWCQLFKGVFKTFTASTEPTGNSYLMLYLLCNENKVPLQQVNHIKVNLGNPYVKSLLDGLDVKYWDISLVITCHRVVSQHYEMLLGDPQFSEKEHRRMSNYVVAGQNIQHVRHMMAHPLGNSGDMSNVTYNYCIGNLELALDFMHLSAQEKEAFRSRSNLLSTVRTADIDKVNDKLKELQAENAKLKRDTAELKNQVSAATVAQNKAEELKNKAEQKVQEKERQRVEAVTEVQALRRRLAESPTTTTKRPTRHPKK